MPPIFKKWLNISLFRYPKAFNVPTMVLCCWAIRVIRTLRTNAATERKMIGMKIDMVAKPPNSAVRARFDDWRLSGVAADTP